LFKANWDPKEFCRLLYEWLVACDQPFQEVEWPEFHRLLQCVWFCSAELDILSAWTACHNIMEMGKDLMRDLKVFFAVSFPCRSQDFLSFEK